MTSNPTELLAHRIAIVDDERQVHASIRLRLGQTCELTSFFDAREALRSLAEEKFDLCLVDIHMPHMDGLTFIAEAAKRDPALGCVVVSAFDTEENLRRSIPLQVYDFIPKPLPDRTGFEARLPGWVAQTRQRRRDRALAQQAGSIERDLDSARIERDVELVASESARDALLQTASLLTTIHAHLVSASSLTAARAKADPTLMHLLRNLEAGLKTAEAAVSVTEGFFDSAYGNRDTSPALINAGLRHAVSIAGRMSRAEEDRKAVDLTETHEHLPVQGLSGIAFLLMLIPAIGLSLAVTEPGTTVRLQTETLPRLEHATRDLRFKNALWVNRRNAVISQPGVLIAMSASGPAFSRAQAEAWLKGEDPTHASVTARGLVMGVQKCRGLLGFKLAPNDLRFQLLLVLPT